MSFNSSCSRRGFLGLVAGATVGAAVGAGVGAVAGGTNIFGGMSFSPHQAYAAQTARNKTTIKAADFKTENFETDVLVIGSGMAGLFAAVKAFDQGAKVHMVSKGGVGRSGLTPFGKGILSYDKKNAAVSEDEFLRRIAESSIGTNNPIFTKQLLDHSYDRVQELKEWGFFDSALCHDAFMKPLNERKIPIHERVMITHLLKENGAIVGASGFSIDENTIIHFHAKTTILCTGAGGFKPNGFPMCDLTHDGTIMAYKAGAKVTGKEWNDGHPASAINSGSCYDNWNGQIEEKPHTTGVRINHHLGVNINYTAYMDGAPVARGTQDTVAPNRPAPPFVPAAFAMTGGPSKGHGEKPEGRGRPPHDGQRAPHGEHPEGQGRPPHDGKRPPHGHEGPAYAGGGAAKREHKGPDARGEQVGGSTAGMAIHKAEGLVPINKEGLTTLPCLYAAGDALGSYMVGTIYTQIGSSLAGSAIQGAIAGEAAARDIKKIAAMTYASDEKLERVKEEILRPIVRERGFSPAWITQVLQGIMIPNFVLYIQKESIMQAALIYVNELYEHHVPMLMAHDLHTLRLAHETENMIISAQMKLKASLMRTESRCSHYRLDYPEVDYENWQAWINIYQDDNGDMQLEKQAFGTWPKV